MNSPVWNVWEIGQGHAVCLPAFNLHQGTTIYHLSEVKALLSTEEWAEVPWPRMLRTHKCSGQKNTIGFLGLKYTCLDTVCSNYIWLSFCVCQIYLQDGLLRDVGAEEAWFFCKTLLKLEKMFRNILCVYSPRRKAWYVSVKSHVPCSCYRRKTGERGAIGSCRQLLGHSWHQVRLDPNTRPFSAFSCTMHWAAAGAATALVQQ